MITPTFFQLSHVLVLLYMVNYAYAEDTIIEATTLSKVNAIGFEEVQPFWDDDLHKTKDEDNSDLNQEPARKKRQMHQGTISVSASRIGTMHPTNTGGGSSYGRANYGSNRRSQSNPNGIVNHQKAQALLGEPNALCIIGDELSPAKNPTPVLSVAGVGTISLGGTIGDSIIAGIKSAIGKMVTTGKSLVSTSPMGVLIVSISYIPAVGVDSGKVTRRVPETFMSVQIPARVMNLPDKPALLQAAKDSEVVNMPVRGELVTETNVAIRMVKTPIVQPVKVMQAERDRETGLFSTTLPDSVVSGGKLVTTPPTVPNVQGQRPLVNPIASPPVTVHTGDVDGLRSTFVRPFPASEASTSRDVVLVYPEDSGLEPVYVMYNKPRKGVLDADHDYHQAPKTEEITGFPGIISVRRKNPRQGGGGLRERWKDAKGRTIYEWDSRHGDLEAYQASDGTHLGSFDFKTGEQRDEAKPERSIKKQYL